MIIITGATGTLGSQIVEQVLLRVPAEQVGVSVRDVTKAAHLAARGVRVRSGDFTDPTTLVDAFEGADQVLVVSAAIRGGSAFDANSAAIDAARAAGARRILYTSHQAAAPDSHFAAMPVHAATEQHLAQVGVAFTALRNGFYASTLAHHISAGLQTGTLELPEDGPVSWTAHADLAEAAAHALVGDTGLDGITPPLTAPATADFAEVAYLLSEITGRAVRRVVVSDEAWRRAAIERGMPSPAAEFTLGMFQAARRGEFSVTDPTLERVVGHPATSVRTVLESIVAAAEF